MELKDIIAGCLKNKLKAQEQLYRKFSGQLFGVCLKYTSTKQEAQDQLHDGFLLILEKLSSYKFEGSFEGWAKRIVINNILQQYRKKVFTEQIAENHYIEENDEPDLSELNLDIEFLEQLINDLPKQYQLVFKLYALENYSHKEIAENLDISVGTSKSNLSRARNLLKTKIEEAIILKSGTYE